MFVHSKHGDEHSQQAISDTTQGATVVMTNLAQARVVMFAARVVLDTGTSPMIEGVAWPLVAAVAHKNLPALATLFGHRRNAPAWALRRDNP